MKLFKRIEKRIFIQYIIVLIVVTGTLFLAPELSNYIINKLFAFCTNELGFLFLFACLVSFAFLIWISSSKFGSIKLGDKEEPKQFSDFSWYAMLFTAGVGTSIVILGFLEPFYYVSAPPFGIEPLSNQAYEYAHMYGQFHWGFSAWPFIILQLLQLHIPCMF